MSVELTKKRSAGITWWPCWSGCRTRGLQAFLKGCNCECPESPRVHLRQIRLGDTGLVGS
jgi:hypothetical protein